MLNVNPDNSRHMLALSRAVEHSFRKMEPARVLYNEVNRAFTGSHYWREHSQGVHEQPTPVNVVQMAIKIYMRHLVGGLPQVLVSPKNRTLASDAVILEAQINQRLKDIDFKSILRELTMQSMYRFAVAKITTSIHEVRVDDYLYDLGQPGIDVVTLPNWVQDMTSKHIRRAAFWGNKYALPIDYVRQSNNYRSRARHLVQSDTMSAFSQTGEERPESLTLGLAPDEWRLKDMVELWDIWLPLERLLVTFPVNGQPIPLRVQAWTGPEYGPYHVLSYFDVPDNPMPLGVVSSLMDMHNMINTSFRKLARQMHRQKTVTFAQGQARSDADRLIQANDGDVIIVQHPEGVREHRSGGIDPSSMAFWMQTRELFSWMAGNMDTLGGLASGAETLGQEQLLVKSSSLLIQHMQDRLLSFTKRLVRDLGSYIFHDAITEQTLSFSHGQGLETFQTIRPGDVRGRFWDFNFDVVPYSFQDQSPAERLQTLDILWQRLSNLAPMLEAQGGKLDVEGYVKLWAKYANMPDLEQIISFATPDPNRQLGIPTGSEGPRQAANTTRTNVRINRGGGQGAQQAAIASLMSAGQGQGVAA